MDRHVVLPPKLCNLTWIVTHKIATKICIPQQDLADDFDDDALKKFHRIKRIIVSSKWANCVEKWKRYVLREYYMMPKGRPRGPWNYKLVTIFLSLSGHFVLVSLRILQVLETTMSRYGETCILNRYRSPYAHQKNHYTRSRSRSKSRSRSRSRERSRRRDRYYLNV